MTPSGPAPAKFPLGSEESRPSSLRNEIFLRNEISLTRFGEIEINFVKISQKWPDELKKTQSKQIGHELHVHVYIANP
jgi:hypothetical protein